MITKYGKPAAEAKQLRPADRPSFTALLMGIPMLSK
jgi:hypothetical protein